MVTLAAPVVSLPSTNNESHPLATLMAALLLLEQPHDTPVTRDPSNANPITRSGTDTRDPDRTAVLITLAAPAATATSITPRPTVYTVPLPVDAPSRPMYTGIGVDNVPARVTSVRPVTESGSSEAAPATTRNVTDNNASP